MELKDNLYRFRKEKGFSQEELAVLCHVSRQAVSKWENGTSRPDSDNLVLLSRYLEVTTDALLGIEPIEKKQEQMPFVLPYRDFSYTTKTKLFGLPLIDISLRAMSYRCFGYRLSMPVTKVRCAKGIFAIGNKAMGVFTLSILGLGLFGIGILNIGLLLSVGLLSLGFYSFGILAFGFMAFGVIAGGVYAFGVVSIAWKVAAGVAVFSKELGVGIAGTSDTWIQMSEGRSTCLINNQDFQILHEYLNTQYLPSIMRSILQGIPLCH